MIGLDSPVASVLGDQSPAKRRAISDGLGLRTVGDLLRHHPRRYLATGELTAVDDLVEGQLLTVVGRIGRSDARSYHDRRSGRRAYRLEVVVDTDGASLLISFFSKTQRVADWHARRLARGRTGIFAGQVGRFRGQWQLTNPKVAIFGDPEDNDDVARAMLDSLPGLFPLYPLTKNVDSWDLHRVVDFARSVIDDIPDVIPAEIRERHRLPDARTAVDLIHAPADQRAVERARRRYRWEEALITQVVMARRRAQSRAVGTTPRTGGDHRLLAAFDEALPWPLTAGQLDVGRELADDLARPHPMNRLLQGEVGSGKTVVALRAMLAVVDSGGQAALLAPTEVLAQQHHRSIQQLLGELAAGGQLTSPDVATRVVLLTGSQTKTQRREPLLALASGDAGIVIGTHALLEDRVEFADLGLVVIDEQHRFGVEQRAALLAKAASPPHVLVMTATPIPRTVAMTVFGDLEVSTLADLPIGRASVQSTVVPIAEQPHWWDRIWQRIREEVADGRQAFIVCPRITGDEAESGQAEMVDLDADGLALPVPEGPASVDELAPALSDGPLAGLRVERLHGRLAAEDKDRVMTDFAAGRIDVVVATTVIEVGVDVANATMMVVVDADRFGVSQLHQLRGRIGRGQWPGLCLLVTRAAAESPARARLDAVAACTDGFELSRVDLDLRREGDVLGASQSGRRSTLHSLRVLRDEETITAARSEAEILVARDPTLAHWPPLADAVADLERSVAAEYMEMS